MRRPLHFSLRLGLGLLVLLVGFLTLLSGLLLGHPLSQAAGTSHRSTVLGRSSAATITNNLAYKRGKAETVYFTDDNGILHALLASSGQLRWRRSIRNTDSSPTLVNGIVYVGSENNNIDAFNAQTGAKLWSFTTGGAVYSLPAVANGIVYVGSDAEYALNAQTGAKLWSFASTSGAAGSPAVANGIVYFGANVKNLYALNAQTGAELWSFTLPGGFGTPMAAT